MKKLLLVIILMIVNQLSAEDNLVAHWSFEDSTAKDFSGNGNHGTFMNSPTPALGHDGIGTSIYLEGYGVNSDQGDHILLPEIPFEDYDEFTICMWVKEISVSSREGEAYINFGDHSSGWLGIMHHIIQPDYGQTDRYYQVSVGSIIYEIDYLDVNFPSSYMNKWKHYAITYDGTYMKFYIDGELKGTLEQDVKLGSTNAAIGRHWWSDGTITSSRLTAYIDDVKIYNKLLSTDDISCGCDKADEHYVDIDLNKKYFCEGDSLFLDANIVPDDISCEYNWTGPNGFTYNGKSFSINDLNSSHSGTYFVTATSTEGNEYTNDTTINVSKFPVVSIYGDSVFCAETGTRLSLDYREDPAKIVWSTGESTMSIKVFETGSYWVYFENTSGCGDTAYYDVRAKDKFEAFVDGQLELCRNDSVYIAAFPQNENMIYEWSTGEKTNSIYIDEPGEYNVRIKELNGCEETIEFNVEYEEYYKPELNLDSPLKLCSEKEIMLGLDNPVSDYKYYWENGSEVTSRIIYGEGEYILYCETNAGCIVSDTLTVIMFDKPEAKILEGEEIYLCGDIDIELNAEISNADYYLWSTGETTKSINANESGKYWVTGGFIDNNECVDTAFTEIFISDSMEIQIISNKYICNDESILIKSNYNSSSYSYLWSTGETNSEIIISEPGQYWLKISSNSGCEDSTNFEIIEYTLSEVELNYKDNIELCDGETITIQPIEINSELDYKWSTGETNPGIIIQESGEYVLYYTNGYCEDSVSINVNYNAKPNIEISAESIYLCQVDELKITADTDIENVSYIWSTGETTKEIKVSEPGNYTVIVESENGCLDTASIEIFESNIEVEIQGDNLICETESTVLSVEDIFSNYLWSTGNNSNAIEVDKVGWYWVEVENEFGCIALDSIYVDNDEIDLVFEPKGLDFGQICYGETNTMSITFDNIYEDEIEISIEKLNNENSFALSHETIKIAPNENKLIDISFTPNDLGIFNDTLLLTAKAKCQSEFTIPLNGICVVRNIVSIPNYVTALDSNYYDIEVKIEQSCDFPDDLELDFDAKISYNSKAFNFHQTSDAKLNDCYISNDYQSIEVTGKHEFSNLRTNLFKFNGKPLLNKDISSPLLIDTVIWNNPFVITDYIKGSLDIKEVCKSELIQIELIETSSINVTPNPASSNIMMSVKSEEVGNHTLLIINNMGDVVNKIEFENVNKLDKSIVIETKDYSSGIYNIILISPLHKHHKKIMIMK